MKMELEKSITQRENFGEALNVEESKHKIEYRGLKIK